MTDNANLNRTASECSRTSATVTHLESRRRYDNVLRSMTFVFGGVHYGTIALSTPYTKDKPIVLYFLPEHSDGDRSIAGPLDILITDEEALGADIEAAQ